MTITIAEQMPPRIAHWLARFAAGAAVAYQPQWSCVNDGIRALLPSHNDPSPEMQVCCCPLTAQYTWETGRSEEPLEMDNYLWPDLLASAQVTETEARQIAAAADGSGWTSLGPSAGRRPLTPVEGAIRQALLRAIAGEEG